VKTTISNKLSPIAVQAQIMKLRKKAERMAELWGHDHEQTSMALCLVADALEENGQMQEAGEIFVRVLEKMKIDPGFAHPHTLIIATKVAIFWRDQGKFEPSEKMFHRVIETLDGAPIPDYDLIYTNLSALGKLMEFADRFPEAEEFHKRALEGRSLLFGPDDPRTRTSAKRLARVEEKLNRERAV